MRFNRVTFIACEYWLTQREREHEGPNEARSEKVPRRSVEVMFRSVQKTMADAAGAAATAASGVQVQYHCLTFVWLFFRVFL
jgi:hypothetical protein